MVEIAMTNEDWPQIMLILREVAEIASGVRPVGHFEIKKIDTITLSMYQRTLSLFKGVTILLDNKSPEEALILARSLFSEVLWLQELESSDDNRAGLLIKWKEESYSYFKKWYEDAQRTFPSEKFDEIFQYLDNKKRELERYKTRHGIKTRSFLPVKNAAEKYGLKTEYLNFVAGHHFVHGNDMAHLRRRKLVGDDLMVISTETDDVDFRRDVGMFASRSLLRGVDSICSIFKWELPDSYNDVLRRVEIFSSELGDGRG